MGILRNYDFYCTIRESPLQLPVLSLVSGKTVENWKIKTCKNEFLGGCQFHAVLALVKLFTKIFS